MKFEWRHGLIWVSIIIVYEGISTKIDNCIIDTGSKTTMIDIDLIEFNYQKPAIIKRLFGIGNGTQEVICQPVDKVIIADIELEYVEMEFGNIKEKLGINGLIGNDILSKFILKINYEQQIIEFTL